MNASKILFITGSGILGFLGVLHLYLTFFTDRLWPSDKKLTDEMRRISPKLTKELTMWRAWVGFNASHSIGILFIAMVNCFLAVSHFNLVAEGHFFFLLNIVTVSYYVFLAKKYWFSKPLIGTVLALLCFITSYLLLVSGK